MSLNSHFRNKGKNVFPTTVVEVDPYQNLLKTLVNLVRLGGRVVILFPTSENW
jgi:hypothetical protein